jgi:hypothetical protein
MDYALCPMRYWWRHRVGVVAPATMETLPYLAMRQGLSWYYRGEVPKLVDGVLRAWAEWMREWRCPEEALGILERYGHAEHEILARFAAGEFTRRDGSLYQAPRMTKKYAGLCSEASLDGLRGQLERMTRGVPVPARTRYHLAEAFSDSILWAARYGGPRREAGQVVGDYQFRVPVTDGITVQGHAAVVLMAGEKVIQAEVHDYEYDAAQDAAVSRHLAMIALANAAGPEWEGDVVLTYRHMRTGGSMVLDWTEPATRLLPVLVAAIRGVECGVFLPRIAAAERSCTHCMFYGICVTEDGLDVLDDLDATALDVRRNVPVGLEVGGLVFGEVSG